MKMKYILALIILTLSFISLFFWQGTYLVISGIGFCLSTQWLLMKVFGIDNYYGVEK